MQDTSQNPYFKGFYTICHDNFRFLNRQKSEIRLIWGGGLAPFTASLQDVL